MKSKVKLLEAALKAAEDIISHYEEEVERSSYDDEDVPEELLELEKAFHDAKEKLKAK